eukprot:217981-Chlamydomonas_euryale.AAC.1
MTTALSVSRWHSATCGSAMRALAARGRRTAGVWGPHTANCPESASQSRISRQLAARSSLSLSLFHRGARAREVVQATGQTCVVLLTTAMQADARAELEGLMVRRARACARCAVLTPNRCPSVLTATRVRVPAPLCHEAS